MTRRFYSTPVGNTLPDGYEVVWNGTHDKQLSSYWQAQATRGPAPSQTQAATTVGDSSRDCDRVLRYLVANRELAHSARSVCEALGVDIRVTSTWLSRFTKRGLLTKAELPRGFMGAATGCVYRVRPLDLP